MNKPECLVIGCTEPVADFDVYCDRWHAYMTPALCALASKDFVDIWSTV